MMSSTATDIPRQEPQKSYHTILEQHVRQAHEELERPAGALLLSGLSAGLDLGFGPFLMAVIATLTSDELPHSLTQILVSLAYVVGFIFVVIGRSALFTEQTTSAVLPVLAHRANFSQLLRLWALVLCANLVGAAVIAAVISQVGPRMGVIEMDVLGKIASRLLDHEWWIMLLSAIAAGWLMGLLAWLVIASRDTVSQIIAVTLTTFVIGIAGFHHSIAGTIEVLMAAFAGAGPTLADYGGFLLWSVLGNAIGGAVFVAVLKSGHVRAS
jgi:formate-nitrite transporter family protein